MTREQAAKLSKLIERYATAREDVFSEDERGTSASVKAAQIRAKKAKKAIDKFLDRLIEEQEVRVTGTQLDIWAPGDIEA